MKQSNTKEHDENKKLWLLQIERALQRAAEVARKTARFYGTPIYIGKDGKVVAVKP
ncbi:MAG TPA: hypothetical protein VJK54_09780 [Chthoniobacterales bacterium]|nr:hypothetical protein [Chthoniobacterales bacterium]